jgi:hypothetical protein
MKKVIVLFIFILHSFFYAQSKDIDCKIKFVDGKELNAKVRFRVSMFYENEIYENSITQKNVVFVNEKGKKEKHLFNEFKSIEFIDLKGKERIFERPIEKYGLFELIYEGKKIKWYRDYNENMYDHSQGSYEIIVKSPNEYVFLDFLTNNRKKLKEIMYDRPDLFQLIEQINYNRLKDEQLIEVLKKYDE